MLRRIHVPLTAAVCLGATAAFFWLLRPVTTVQIALILTFAAIVTITSVATAASTSPAPDAKPGAELTPPTDISSRQ
jgi:hypothetical protein